MISIYLNRLQSELNTGNAREHSYRPAIKELFESLNPIIKAVNEPTRSEYGSPDFIFLNSENRDFIHGYAETKDITVNLDQIEKTDQLKRYLGYPNLILTNYLEFRFYRNGEKYLTIELAKKLDSTFTILTENFELFERELNAFLSAPPENIQSGKRLAEIMGGKAARIRSNVIKFLEIENEKNEEILKVYKAMRELLVHDLEPKAFADMYAQTLVYGLFVARYYDETPENFTRSEARDLIPASNPFLQHFFDHIAGASFDKRLGYIVDELCDVFSVSDVNTIVNKHYKITDSGNDKDPIIHFYEDFLKEYDPALKKKMGAYYTPVPVVQFMIRAVDEILKKDFSLKQGVADTSTVEVKMMQQGTKAKKTIHRVQVLDPAVGTATFLNETIKLIYSKFKGQEGRWESYVERELLPRLHGFELMMAPYTIAHLKLAMTLKETGINQFKKRLSVYLTNSLEEGINLHEDWFSLGFADAINEESRAASVIKKETPIMVVLGNPPYFGESNNKSYKGQDIYKLEPTGGKLKEKNPKWINDDYVRFMRFSESMIEETEEGIVAMITAHGYIDNPTFRGMRFHLMQTFDDIYILDMHGNINKREKSPDGTEDKNIFDIKTGVAIFLGVKRKNSKSTLANIYKTDLWGNRTTKFKYLNENLLNTVAWTQISPSAPNYEWVKRDVKKFDEYKKGIPLNELFPITSVGIVTARDRMSVQNSKKEIATVIQDFMELDSESLRTQYSLGADVRDWQVALAKKDVIENYDNNRITSINYRPFDKKWTFYTGNSKGFHCMPRGEIMKNLLDNDLSLIAPRQVKSGEFYHHVLAAKGIVESTYISNKTSEIGYVFPLYIKHKNDESRTPNLDEASVSRIISELYLIYEGKKNFLQYVGDEKTKSAIVLKYEHDTDKLNIFKKSIVSPLDIYDYIYGCLHSPNYRDKYKEFLKIDFPRIPTPVSGSQFWKLAELGGELRKLHLLESQKVNEFITTYPVAGSNIVEKLPEYKNGKVFINDVQYFGNVPEIIWNFYIGGYQPVQKWLKDKRGRALTNEDIEHYQKMIVSLKETEKNMIEIDKILNLK